MTVYTILPRRDEAADWTAANPTLGNGQFGVELDTGKLKLGDGVTAWNDLDYFAGVSGAVADLSDATITTPADNELFAFDNASGDWINKTAAEAALATSTHDHDADYAAIAHASDTTNPHSVTAAQADALPEDAGIVNVSATHTLLAANAGKVHLCSGTFTVTLPDGLDTGYQVSIVNTGAGTITLSATTTLQSSGAAVTLATQYEGCVAVHIGSNVWLAMGGLE